MQRLSAYIMDKVKILLWLPNEEKIRPHDSMAYQTLFHWIAIESDFFRLCWIKISVRTCGSCNIEFGCSTKAIVMALFTILPSSEITIICVQCRFINCIPNKYRGVGDGAMTQPLFQIPRNCLFIWSNALVKSHHFNSITSIRSHTNSWLILGFYVKKLSLDNPLNYLFGLKFPRLPLIWPSSAKKYPFALRHPSCTIPTLSTT